MYRTRNAACLEGYRGFESHPLRHRRSLSRLSVGTVRIAPENAQLFPPKRTRSLNSEAFSRPTEPAGSLYLRASTSWSPFPACWVIKPCTPNREPRFSSRFGPSLSCAGLVVPGASVGTREEEGNTRLCQSSSRPAEVRRPCALSGQPGSIFFHRPRRGKSNPLKPILRQALRLSL